MGVEMERRHLSDIVDAVIRETRRAKTLHAPMANAHEALAVIQEEVFEFQLEVYKKQSTRDLKNMRKELVQIAAMAIRAIDDLNLKDAG